MRDEAAQNLFVRSRAAVVHTGTVTQLRSLILRGHLRTTADNGAPLEGAIEIKVLLPDSFLRVETYADVQRFTGFTGKSLLTAMREGNRVELPPDNATAPLLRCHPGAFHAVDARRRHLHHDRPADDDALIRRRADDGRSARFGAGRGGARRLRRARPAARW